MVKQNENKQNTVKKVWQSKAERQELRLLMSVNALKMNRY